MPERPKLAPLVVLLAVAFCARAAWVAWVSDDAYLTLRTVDHIARGHGPCWNVGERVQVYTHPLWMFLLAALTTVTREHYLTAMVLGLVLSAAAISILVTRVARSALGALVALCVLTLSGAFTDYSTSGLENPLAHVLLALFCVALFSEDRRAAPLAFLFAALAACNRLDAVLVVLPGVAVLAWRGPPRRIAASLTLAWLPWVAWEAFSLVYYGSLVPNPALAKLATGIPVVDLAAQGEHYLANSLRLDPVTLAATATGIVLAFARRDARTAALGAGIGLHLLYVLRVGGDFMSGRFLTTSLFAAAVILACWEWRPRPALAFVLTCTIATAAAFAAARRAPGTPGAAGLIAAIDSHGIADERRFYARLSGWRFARTDVVWPDPATARAALEARVRWPEDPFVERLRALGLVAAGDSLPARVTAGVRDHRGRTVLIRGAVGTLGYYAGPSVHVLDLYALGDPLRARLPAEKSDPLLPLFLGGATTDPWRPGHFVRRIPAGYVATLASGENLVVDPGIAALWEDVARLTRGPLFVPARWRAIGRLAWPRHEARADSRSETEPVAPEETP